jgi:hypothetical protein
MRSGWIEPRMRNSSTWRGAKSESSPPRIAADLDYPGFWRSTRPAAPGILFRGGAYSDAELLGLLDRVLTRTPALDLAGSIVVVDPRRIRRRALPIVEWVMRRRFRGVIAGADAAYSQGPGNDKHETKPA